MRRGKVVSFRVAEEHYQLLMARSAQGGSPGSLARELMLQALHSDSMVDEIKSHFDQQRIALTELQSSLFRAFRAALVIFGKFGSKQAADTSQKILGNALDSSDTR